MPATYEIRADYDKDTIVIYQAYRSAIADAALKAGRLVPPFSLKRMTWIKPSFLWLMERSNWGKKSGQENILGVRITREGWDKALSLAVLTTPELSVYGTHKSWQRQFDQALVHIQWDTERSLRGAALPYYSIQIGLSRHIIQEYVDQWVVDVQDYTPLVRKMIGLIQSGKEKNARKLFPQERVYPVDEAIGRRLLIST